jgi:hypothetical protein
VDMYPLRNPTVERVDLFFLPPNWFYSNIPFFSAILVSSSATTFSTILAIIFSRAIGRYKPGSV